MKTFSFYISFCLGLLLFPFYAFASFNSFDDVFLVKSIPVSFSSFSSSEAKKQSLKLARNNAFNSLLNRILLSSDLQNVIIPDDYNMEKFVQSFKIDNEKTTSTSYSASVDVLINKNLLLDYIKNQNLSILEDLPPRTLIVYQNFDMSDFISFLSDPVIPFVNVIPISSLAFDWYNMNNTLLNSLLSSYKANNVILVNVNTLANNVCEVAFQDKVFGIADTFQTSCDKSSLYNSLYSKIKDAYIHVQDLADFSNSVSLLIPIYSIQDWIDIEKKISSIPSIKSFEVQALKYNKAQLKIRYNYDLNSIIASLREAGFDIVNKNGYLIVKR